MKSHPAIAAFLVCCGLGINGSAQEILTFVNPIGRGQTLTEIWPASRPGPTAKFTLQGGQQFHVQLVTPGKFNIRQFQWSPDGSTCTQWYVPNIDLHAIATGSVLSIKLWAYRQNEWRNAGSAWQRVDIPASDSKCAWEFGALPLPVAAPKVMPEKAYTSLTVPTGCPLDDIAKPKPRPFPDPDPKPKPKPKT